MKPEENSKSGIDESHYPKFMFHMVWGCMENRQCQETPLRKFLSESLENCSLGIPIGLPGECAYLSPDAIVCTLTLIRLAPTPSKNQTPLEHPTSPPLPSLTLFAASLSAPFATRSSTTAT